MAQKQRKKRGAGGTNGSKSSTLTWVLGGVAVIAIAVLGYTVGSRAFGDMARSPVELDVESDQELVSLAEGVVLGDPDAPVTIVEFADFQCPGCASFARQVKPLVDRQLVEPGTASFVFYDFPLIQMHGNAFLAARAARCAGDQDLFWDYHDLLFQNQSQWATDGSPAGRFVSYAEELGVDVDAFEGCLRSDMHARTVTANMRLGEVLGVSGTPTVMVSEGRGMANRLMSNDFDSIREAVDEAIEDQDAQDGEAGTGEVDGSDGGQDGGSGGGQ